jgi:hypothetical protein
VSPLLQQFVLRIARNSYGFKGKRIDINERSNGKNSDQFNVSVFVLPRLDNVITLAVACMSICEDRINGTSLFEMLTFFDLSVF